MTRSLAALALFILAASMTQRFWVDKFWARRSHDTMGVVELAYLPPENVLRFMALGYESAIADLVFIRAAVYFGEHVLGDREFPFLENYVDSVIALDPDIRKLYEFAMVTFMYGEKYIQNPNVLKSIEYAERGIKRFPNYWRFYFWVGFSKMFEIDYSGMPEQEVTSHKLEGLSLMKLASYLPGNDIDPLWIATRIKRVGRKKLAYLYLMEQFDFVTDPARKEQMRWQLRLMRRNIRDQELADAAERLVAEEQIWKAELPFIPRGLFTLLGPRVDKRIPLSWDRWSGLGGSLRPAGSDGLP